MTNADKFKHLFGIYATELWAMPESDFLEWLNADAQDMPTEPERKPGKWINSYKRQTCSVCKQRGYRSWSFCPNCGADMRER